MRVLILIVAGLLGMCAAAYMERQVSIDEELLRGMPALHGRR